MSEEIFNRIKEGKLSPEEALKQFEKPGKKLFDITPSGLRKSLSIGIQTAETANYICENQPNLIIVAARPGFGKSALLFQMAYNVAKTGPVDLYSLEMDSGEVKSRLISQQSGMSMDAFRRADELTQAKVLRKLDVDLIVDDTSGLTINQLISRSKARHKENPLKAIFVDYLQIVATNQSRSQAEEISGIAKNLKSLSKDLQVPIIVAAQMNRNMDGRLANNSNKEQVLPVMSDISDSSGIEKWADCIWFLHREYAGQIPSVSDIRVTVSKNRHGQMQDFRLRFDGPSTSFQDRGPVEGSL